MTFNFAKHDICVTTTEGGIVAAMPKYNVDEDGSVLWFGLERRSRRYKVEHLVVDEPDRLVFVDPLHREFTLEPLTEKNADAVRSALGAPALATVEQLRAAILAAL